MAPRRPVPSSPALTGPLSLVRRFLLRPLRGLGLAVSFVAWLLAADVLLSASLPFMALFPDRVYNFASRVAGGVWLWVQRIFESANSAHISMSGDALPPGESAVVVANHVAWSDFYMIQALALRAGMLGRCRWFSKRELKWVPFLGWGMWAIGFPMVSRNWIKDKKELERVFRGIVERRWPTWLISYSEATRFTHAKYVASQKWCEATGNPQPLHLLYPRTKGFVATVQQLRKAPHVRAVYDITIAYQRYGRVRAGASSPSPSPAGGPEVGSGDGWQWAPSIWETLSVPDLSREAPGGYRFHVHARRFPIEDLPPDDEGLARWLEKVWVEKGEYLEGLRKGWASEEEEMVMKRQ